MLTNSSMALTKDSTKSKNYNNLEHPNKNTHSKGYPSLIQHLGQCFPPHTTLAECPKRYIRNSPSPKTQHSVIIT